MSNKADERKGIMIVVICGALWGLSGVLGQMLFQSSDITVEWLSSIKMLTAGVLILGGLAVKRDVTLWKVWKRKRDIVQLVVFSIGGVMILQYSYFEAVAQSNAATATVLQYTYPILMLIYNSVKNRKKPSGGEGVAIFVAFLGVVLIATHGSLSSLSITHEALIWGTVSAVTFVFYTVYPFGLYERNSIVSVMGWSLLLGGAELTLLTGCYETPPALSFYNIGLTGAVTILGTLVPFILYSYGVKKLGDVKASLVVTVEPVFSAIMTAVLLQVTFASIDLAGFACIIGAIWLATCKSSSRKQLAQE